MVYLVHPDDCVHQLCEGSREVPMGHYGGMKCLCGCHTMKVVHCKKSKYDVLIDRSSPWGNPFRIGQDGSRKEVIAKFEGWIIRRPRLIESAKFHLWGKTLGCWCSPQACHGDVWISLLKGGQNDRRESRKNNVVRGQDQ